MNLCETMLELQIIELEGIMLPFNTLIGAVSHTLLPIRTSSARLMRLLSSNLIIE